MRQAVKPAGNVACAKRGHEDRGGGDVSQARFGKSSGTADTISPIRADRIWDCNVQDRASRFDCLFPPYLGIVASVRGKLTKASKVLSINQVR